MAEGRVQRRLAAILAADVVGYSRLMGEDEEGTLAAVKSHIDEVLDPEIAAHHGRIFKTMGDAVFAEFASVVDAVRCSAELQEAMGQRNISVPEDRRIVFRIGINMGDIIVEGGDIFGNGVNVAARLEGLAEPGGICISGNVCEQVQGKLNLTFEDMGEQRVKNIAQPVRVYRLILGGMGAAGKTVPGPPPALELPHKRSIAVLPFVNMSGDPQQEYFSDGIADDIITALSRFRWFFVISRNSSFTYKGTAVHVKKVARELGVHYVLEGSVRRTADRVRITGQLIDAIGDRHVWAERYDRELDDIFAVQDEITDNIVASVAPEFLSAEMERAVGKRGSNLDAWERVMQARWHIGMYTKEANETGRQLLLEAIALDPKFAQAYSELSVTHGFDVLYGWSETASQSSAAAASAAQQAVSLDGSDALAHAVLGLVLTLDRKHDDAIDILKGSIRLNPNLAAAHGYLGVVYGLVGDYKAAVEAVDRAMRLSPRDYSRAIWLAGKAMAAFGACHYEEVAELTGRILREYPRFPSAYRLRAAGLALQGHENEARGDIDELLRLLPGLTVSQVRTQVPIKDPGTMERWLDGLRRAGLSE
ncbi:MAG: adenylate/guanylate cyclase domain-containing protein [Kiloniellales bacterium]